MQKTSAKVRECMQIEDRHSSALLIKALFGGGVCIDPAPTNQV